MKDNLPMNHLYAVMNRDFKVQRIMKTELGAKAYATKRGLVVVGRIDSRDSVDIVWYKESGRKYKGWQKKRCKSKVTFHRGIKAIEEFF